MDCQASVLYEQSVEWGDEALNFYIDPITSIDHIEAEPAKQHVIAGPAGEDVVTITADYHIVAVPALAVSDTTPATSPEASTTSSPASCRAARKHRLVRKNQVPSLRPRDTCTRKG